MISILVIGEYPCNYAYAVHVGDFCVGRLIRSSCTHRFTMNNSVDSCTIQYIRISLISGHKKLGIVVLKEDLED